jgi:putative transposase
MAIARCQQIDISVARWYHCMSRCVRQAFLLAGGALNRKEWLEDWVEELAEIFAVGVGGFSVMENHLHILLRLDPDVAQSWSDEEVTLRWGRLFPPRDKSRQPLPVTEAWVQDRIQDVRWVAKTRGRLQSIS